MAKKKETNSLSDTYYNLLKNGYLQSIEREINNFLVGHGGGKLMLPFYINPADAEYFTYYLIEDLDLGVGFEGLEELTDRIFAEFSEGDHVCALVNGNTLKSVKFHLGRGFWSLKDAMSYGDIVGINHAIYFLGNGDLFKFTEDGKNIFYLNEQK